jgi:putative NIF3 family GTP cyclohydrolase 1 type 2
MLDAFAARVGDALERTPLVIGDGRTVIRRVAWCTGAAQGLFEAALAAGVDAYITGEISEQHVHLARESGVAFIAAGHHATERYGVQALGRHLAATFSLDCTYIDVDNPV